MRIWGSGSERGQVKGKETGTSSLRKGEFIADLFNAQKVDNQGKAGVKLYLSHSSRAMQEEWKEKVAAFLEDNPRFAGKLEEIEVPSTEEMPQEGLSLRRFGAYVSWLKMDKKKEGVKEPYGSLCHEGKDEEILTMVKERDARLQEIKTERQRHQPNYYYLVYPETYSFN